MSENVEDGHSSEQEKRLNNNEQGEVSKDISQSRNHTILKSDLLNDEYNQTVNENFNQNEEVENSLEIDNELRNDETVTSVLFNELTTNVSGRETVHVTVSARDVSLSGVSACEQPLTNDSMLGIENLHNDVATTINESSARETSAVGPLPDRFPTNRIQEPNRTGPTQPPSYTSVEIRRPSIPFIQRVPPPSYGEAMGIEHLRSPGTSPLIVNVGPSVWTHRTQPAFCRQCHAVVVSKVRRTPCTFTHMAAGLLFLFMCWPFCFLPYCVNYCQKTTHFCPNCNQVLGVYNPII